MKENKAEVKAKKEINFSLRIFTGLRETLC
jgi:hypothetical protein